MENLTVASFPTKPQPVELDEIIQFETYQLEALKTASMEKGREMEGFVRVCGLVGEAAELRDELLKVGSPSCDRTKILKELGDVMWYAATLSEWLKLGVHFTFDTLQRAAVGCAFDAMYSDIICLRAAKLSELMKKHLGHDKPMDDFMGKELELMQDVFMAIAFVANTVNLPLKRAAAVNINKLRARYQGGGFTSTLANAHVDERTEQQAENAGDLS